MKALSRDFKPRKAQGAEGVLVCQAADKLIRTFAEQIFYTGFIHADPHPGNGASIIHILQSSSRAARPLNDFLCLSVGSSGPARL